MDSVLKRRKRDTHKGDYGRVGIVGGSKGMAGAVYLASQGALRTGSGLVYSIVPSYLDMIMAIKLNEVIVRSVEDENKGYFNGASRDGLMEEIRDKDVLCIGMGMGCCPERYKLMKDIILSVEGPMVLDADGINCISENLNILLEKKGKIVLTPHLGELSRLLGVDIKDIREDRFYYGKYLSKKYDVTLIMKGEKTLVFSPDREVYINKSGNPGMATAGSGDVLSGVIASLIGQGLEVEVASELGVYLHGLAGDLAAKDKGEYGLIAGDIVEYLPRAIEEFLKNGLTNTKK